MTHTYRTVENILSASLATVAWEELPTLSEARQAFGTVRQAHGLSPSGWSTFLSPEDSIDKLGKGDGLPLIALALTHASGSGWNLCPYSGECVSGCVAESGNGGYDRVKRTREARTALLMAHPREAFVLILADLDRLDAKSGGKFGARLNAFSDIRWERVFPGWFWHRYKLASFYDYTKHPVRSRPTLPFNYRLTYSYSEKTTDREVKNALRADRNVAVVVSIRGGKLRGTQNYRPIPETIFGSPVVDGDKNDRRYADPVGVVVALRRKGSLKADSPFVVSV